MQESLQRRCDLFVENTQLIKEGFRWESGYLFPACAEMLTAAGRRADIPAMKDCRALLKQETGFFSNFRGISEVVTLTKLSMSKNPQERLVRIQSVYAALKEWFRNSEFLVLAAAIVVDLAEPAAYVELAARAREIYNQMKSNHPFLTGGEDSTFAVLFALSDLAPCDADAEMERCYTLLKNAFFSGNALQSLSHVLALGQAPAAQKCERVAALFQLLKDAGHKYGTGYELPTLGVLALLDTDLAELAQRMTEADAFLKAQKGFGSVFGIGSRQRLMYAGMLTMGDAVPQTTIQAAALQGTMSLIIAQQAAVCASMAASTAAASAAASN